MTLPLRRQLLDFHGTLAAGSVDAVILVDRPAAGSSIQGSVMKIGFPNALPNDATLAALGIEEWLGSASTVSQLYFTSGQSLVVPLGLLPAPGGVQFSIQFVSSLPAAVCGNPAFTWGASPALVFGY